LSEIKYPFAEAYSTEITSTRETLRLERQKAWIGGNHHDFEHTVGSLDPNASWLTIEGWEKTR